MKKIFILILLLVGITSAYGQQTTLRTFKKQLEEEGIPYVEKQWGTGTAIKLLEEETIEFFTEIHLFSEEEVGIAMVLIPTSEQMEQEMIQMYDKDAIRITNNRWELHEENEIPVQIELLEIDQADGLKAFFITKIE